MVSERHVRTGLITTTTPEVTPQGHVERTRAGGVVGGIRVAVLALSGTVVALQQTIVLPVLPEAPELLGGTPENALWLVTATLIAGAVATPVMARLADTHGKRRIMLVTLGIVVAGCVLGLFSNDLPVAIVARALQGVGMALIPIAIAMIREVVPRRQIPIGVSAVGASMAIGAGAGLPLAGAIVRYHDWHLIFWVTGAGAVVMAVLIVLCLPESTVRQPNTRFDLVGALSVAAALIGILAALSNGAEWGWGAPLTLGCLSGGAVAVVIWVIVERRVRAPLVNLRVAAIPLVALTNVASILIGFALFVNILLTTQIMQIPSADGGRGFDPLQTGLWMAPSVLAFGVGAPLAAAMTRRFGPTATLLVGSLVMAVTYAWRTAVPFDLSSLVIGSIVVSLGTALTFTAVPTIILGHVPITETASANGLNTLLRSTGTAVASAAVATMVATAAGLRPDDGAGANLLAWNTALLLGSVCAAIAAVLAVFMTRHQRRTSQAA